MIINIRGTSGAGKSTLVRELMSRYAIVVPEYVLNRKRPIGYRCDRPGGRSLWVLGHYETACGGGDTVPGLDENYRLVRQAGDAGCDVVYEGLIIQSDTRRCIELSKEHETLVVIIDVPLELCLASIQARRDARGDQRPLNPANTLSKQKTIPSQERKLKEGGVDVRRLNREAGLKACLEALKLEDAVFG
jgi:predicted kinase